jgi:hypothetical protein
VLVLRMRPAFIFGRARAATAAERRPALG